MKVLFEKAKAKNARVQMSEAFITSVFLALSGGFQDAYTYFTRDEVFSNAQTGNVVLMSQHFMLGEWQRGLHYLIRCSHLPEAFSLQTVYRESLNMPTVFIGGRGYYCWRS